MFHQRNLVSTLEHVPTLKSFEKSPPKKRSFNAFVFPAKRPKFWWKDLEDEEGAILCGWLQQSCFKGCPVGNTWIRHLNITRQHIFLYYDFPVLPKFFDFLVIEFGYAPGFPVDPSSAPTLKPWLQVWSSWFDKFTCRRTSAWIFGPFFRRIHN